MFTCSVQAVTTAVKSPVKHRSRLCREINTYLTIILYLDNFNVRKVQKLWSSAPCAVARLNMVHIYHSHGAGLWFSFTGRRIRWLIKILPQLPLSKLAFKDPLRF